MNGSHARSAIIALTALPLAACGSAVEPACGNIDYTPIRWQEIEVPVEFDIESGEIELLAKVTECYRNTPLRKSDDVLIFTGIKREYGNGGVLLVDLAGYTHVSFLVRYSENNEPIWFRQLVE